MLNRIIRKLTKLLGSYNKLLTYQGSVADTYLADRAATVKWHEEHIIFARHIRDLPDGLKVLDVPFGTGRFVPFYEFKGLEVTAMDISRDMLNIAEKYNRLADSLTFCEGSALDLPFERNEFELIVCSRFIGYIPTVEQAIQIFKEFHRVSRTFLYVGVQYLKDNEPIGPEDKLGHRYSRQELINLISDVGFRLVSNTLLEARDNYQNEILMLEKIK